jgi:Arc/MetJ-type ribon-helix-helix transcriptional regulator
MGFQYLTDLMRMLIMARLTVSLNEEEEEIIEDKVGDDGEYESKSEFVRMCIQDHNRNDELETEVDRLRNQKQLILEQREETTSLKRYVEEERSYRNASLPTRLRWWVFGKPETSSV